MAAAGGGGGMTHLEHLERLQRQAAAVAAAPPQHPLLVTAQRELLASAQRLGLTVAGWAEVEGAVADELARLEQERLEARQREQAELELVRRLRESGKRAYQRRMAKRAAG